MLPKKHVFFSEQSYRTSNLWRIGFIIICTHEYKYQYFLYVTIVQNKQNIDLKLI